MKDFTKKPVSKQIVRVIRFKGCSPSTTPEIIDENSLSLICDPNFDVTMILMDLLKEKDLISFSQVESVEGKYEISNLKLTPVDLGLNNCLIETRC